MSVGTWLIFYPFYTDVLLTRLGPCRQCATSPSTERPSSALLLLDRSCAQEASEEEVLSKRETISVQHSVIVLDREVESRQIGRKGDQAW